MNKNSIFISRQVQDNDLWKNLRAKGYVLHAESLIEFSPVSFDIVPFADCLYFYSKNAVKFYHLQNQSIEKSSRKQQIAAHGKQTALAVRTFLNLEIDFTFNPEDLNPEKEFKTFLKEKTVLFIQAKNSLCTLQDTLKKQQYKQLVVYENFAKKDFSIPASKFLIFTSPLNVNTYFSKYDHQKEQQLIAIGATTEKACLQYASRSCVYVSAERSESSLYKRLVHLLD